MGLNHSVATWDRHPAVEELVGIGLVEYLGETTYEQASRGMEDIVGITSIGPWPLLTSGNPIALLPLEDSGIGTRHVVHLSSVASVAHYAAYRDAEMLREVLIDHERGNRETGAPVGDESTLDPEDTDSMESLPLDVPGLWEHVPGRDLLALTFSCYRFEQPLPAPPPAPESTGDPARRGPGLGGRLRRLFGR